MAARSINQVLADNLRHYMEKAGITRQAELAAKSGVSQRTISNYLNPGNREGGSSGKEPSAKLTELDRVATALNIAAWDLIRDMDVSEREAYEKVEAAFRELRGDVVVARDRPPEGKDLVGGKSAFGRIAEAPSTTRKKGGT